MIKIENITLYYMNSLDVFQGTKYAGINFQCSTIVKSVRSSVTLMSWVDCIKRTGNLSLGNWDNFASVFGNSFKLPTLQNLFYPNSDFAKVR